MIKLSICLSDLPKEKITTAKNGKKYINLVMWENREVDKFGNTHSIQVNKASKEETTVYVGNGLDKSLVPASSEPLAPANNSNDSSDLPF
jgi:hypothetical protein